MSCTTRWRSQTILLVFLMFSTYFKCVMGYTPDEIIKNKDTIAEYNQEKDDITRYNQEKDDITKYDQKKGHVSRRQSVFVNNGNIVKVAPSNMAVLPCSVQSVGQKEVVWRRIKDDEVLTIGKLVWSKDHRILVEYSQRNDDVTSWDLIIRHVRHEDAGMYECQLTSTEKIAWHVELKIIDPVTTKPKQRVHKQVSLHPSMTSHPSRISRLNAEGRPSVDKEEYIIAGSGIRLHCNISLKNQSLTWNQSLVRNHSFASTTLDWFKDGDILHSNQRVLLTRFQLETELVSVSELLIDKSNLTDSGEYLCRWRSNDVYIYKIYVLPNTNISSTLERENSFLAAVNIGGHNDASSQLSKHLLKFIFLIIIIFVTPLFSCVQFL